VKRPGKVKGKGMFRMTLESVLLPNGVKHEFRAGLSDVAGTSGEKLDKKEGVVVGPGSKLNDLKNIQTGGSIGAMGGSAVGAASTIASGASTNTRVFTGGGIGAGAGLVGGLVATLLTRGPDAVLLRGADIEMEFNQPVVFEEAELAGLPAPPPGLPAQVSHPQQPADPSGLRRR
jgi:hypothetical protein